NVSRCRSALSRSTPQTPSTGGRLILLHILKPPPFSLLDKEVKVASLGRERTRRAKCGDGKWKLLAVKHVGQVEFGYRVAPDTPLKNKYISHFY
ncbi:10506_t:CDS:1, partial [Acaulospora colombiana]